VSRNWAIVVITMLVSPRCFGAKSSQAQDIVARSVQNMNADWSAAPQFDFTERDVIRKKGRSSVMTYRVLMIGGSPYQRLLAVNGEPLPAAQVAREQGKLQREIARRGREMPSARQKRVAEYQKERRQDHELMAEMVQGFDFKLEGEETLNGRRCYVLDATPRPGYQPKSRETKVLKGMRGKMWIDVQRYQWVKVQAEVFRPVTFGLFVAHVQPGTEFTLEQKPVEGNIWLPSHFSMRVKAQILLFSRRSTDDETYSQYRPVSEPPNPHNAKR